MPQQLWNHLDRYLSGVLIADDPAAEALVASERAGLPAIAVSPTQGKLLRLLAGAVKARAILEIGTLGGYSTIWLASALPPDGKLVTLESNPLHAKVAEENLERAGVSHLVQVRLGPALEALQELAAEGRSFDVVFIDADKRGLPDYFRCALTLTHPGSLIVVDNIVRRGRLVLDDREGSGMQSVREVLEFMGKEPRVSATALQTVGAKGHDGFAVALVTG